MFKLAYEYFYHNAVLKIRTLQDKISFISCVVQQKKPKESVGMVITTHITGMAGPKKGTW